MSNDRFNNWQVPIIKNGELTKWLWVVFGVDKFVNGLKTDIGAFTAIFAHHGVTLEDEVQIGGGCKIYSLDTIGETQGPILLKKNSRVGANSVVLPGVTLGENSIIGANSVIGDHVSIGNNSTIGTGTVIKAGLKIGNNVRIGSNSFVKNDFEDNSKAFGNPATLV